jgi:RNA polymerase sigma-70 factor (ECF subfamily)
VIDESGFEVLYRRTAAPLRAYVTRVIGSATRADDIVQEAYLRLLRTPPAIDDPGQLRAYLFRIASNLIHDHWRQEQRERKSAERHSTERDTLNPDPALRLDMTRLFEQLRPQQRQLMWLAYVEGADHREIAAALGLRERSVRVLLHRARHKLAALLHQRGAARETHDDRRTR